MRTATRWAGCLALMVGGPVVLAMALVWASHENDRLPWIGEPQPVVAQWMLMIACWAAGLVGLHLLPLSRLTRALIAVPYTPVAACLIFLGVFAAGCGWYGACP